MICEGASVMYSLSEDDPTPTSTRETRPTTKHDPRETKQEGKAEQCEVKKIEGLYFYDPKPETETETETALESEETPKKKNIRTDQ